MTSFNSLSEIQMEEQDICPREAEEILSWYEDFVKNIFDTSPGHIDIATMLCEENGLPVVKSVIYSNGKKAKQMGNTYQACIDAKRLVDNQQLKIDMDSENDLG